MKQRSLQNNVESQPPHWRACIFRNPETKTRSRPSIVGDSLTCCYGLNNFFDRVQVEDPEYPLPMERRKRDPRRNRKRK
jgi:hypothetical protein